MNNTFFSLLGLGALCCFPLILHADSVPSVEKALMDREHSLLTSAEAEQIIHERRNQREASERAKRNAILEVPAIAERVLKAGGGQQVVLRHVAPSEEVTVEARKDAARDNIMTSDWSGAFPVPEFTYEQISLVAKVYGDEYSEVTWRDTETREEVKVWTNLNLQYLRPIDTFQVEDVHYDYFGFIYPVTKEGEQKRVEAAKQFGHEAQSRWKSSPIAFSDGVYEYYVVPDGKATVPAKLYRQLDDLFGYYMEHQVAFETSYKNGLMLEAARQKDLKENPPKKPESILVNFTPLRGEAANR